MYTHSTRANTRQTITCARVKFRMGVGEKFRISTEVTECARDTRPHTRGHLDVGVETHEADAYSEDETSGALKGNAE